MLFRSPVIAYKEEGHEMFDEMIERIQTTTISRLLKGRIVRMPANMMRAMQQNAAPAKSVQAPAQPVAPAPKPVDENGNYVPEGTQIHRPKN